jgi:hypothetical protein
MTYPYPSHPPYRPPPVQRGPNYAKIIFFVTLGLMVVVAVITVILAVRLHKSGSTTAASGGGATSAAVAAVCQPGSYEDMSGRHAPPFQGATDIAKCTAKISAFPNLPPDTPPDKRYGVLWIVQFSSPDATRNEAVSKNPLAATALVPLSGTVLFVAPSDWTGASLQPLTHFGFQIMPTHIW